MSDRSNQVIRVGVIGLGFMGATHVAAYQAAAREGFPCELVAVCDRKASRRAGMLNDVGGNIGDLSDPAPAFDVKRVRAYAEAIELIDDPRVDLVSICTRTDTHSDLAIRALRAGKHVLVEKPVAMNVDDVGRVRDVARESNRLCVPAMCMRFWPAWTWLKQRIDDGSLGRCTGLTLTRVGAAPSWSGAFYADASRSGGALVDLHVHDADFVLFCFGRPSSVYSVGDVNHVTTAYRFAGPHAPAHVVAEGAWLAPGTAFRMRYVAAFERATADFDLAHEPQLVVYRDGKGEAVDLPALTGYDQEIRHVVRAIANRESDLAATMDDAVAVTELLDAERVSLERRAVVGL